MFYILNLTKSAILNVIPGLLICFLVMIAGIYGTEFIGFLLTKIGLLSEGNETFVTSIFVSIIIGILIRNIFGVKKYFLDGISFSLKYILRAGIVLLGLKLSLVEALKLGILGTPLIVACITVGLVSTLSLTKYLGQ